MCCLLVSSAESTMIAPLPIIVQTPCSSFELGLQPAHTTVIRACMYVALPLTLATTPLQFL
jgi:hypothetical protein